MKTQWVDANPSQGILGTLVTAAWLRLTGNHRHTGIDEDGNCPLDFYTAGGTANALTITCNPPLTQLIPGMPIYIKAASANTGAVTLNVDGLGTKSITKAGGIALDAGDILAGQIIEVAYDGTNFQLLSAYSLLDYATSTGSANAYVLTLAPALPALVAGRMLTFKANFANTGAATLNVNGLGAKSIKRVSSDIGAGNIQAGQIVTVIYDGTNFQLLTCIDPVASETAAGIVKLATAALAQGLIDDASALTPFKLTQVFTGNQSLGANGYLKLPGGLIIQWGVNGASSSSGTTVFPVAFPNACDVVLLQVFPSPGSSSQVAYVNSKSQTQFDWNKTMNTSNIYWLAIGR